jgi:hypothetical protein
MHPGLMNGKPYNRAGLTREQDGTLVQHSEDTDGSKTQEQAISWAKSNGHTPHVARVRHLNDKKIPAHWRAA